MLTWSRAPFSRHKAAVLWRSEHLLVLVPALLIVRLSSAFSRGSPPPLSGSGHPRRFCRIFTRESLPLQAACPRSPESLKPLKALGM